MARWPSPGYEVAESFTPGGPVDLPDHASANRGGRSFLVNETKRGYGGGRRKSRGATNKLTHPENFSKHLLRHGLVVNTGQARPAGGKPTQLR